MAVSFVMPSSTRWHRASVTLTASCATTFLSSFHSSALRMWKFLMFSLASQSILPCLQLFRKVVSRISFSTVLFCTYTVSSKNVTILIVNNLHTWTDFSNFWFPICWNYWLLNDCKIVNLTGAMLTTLPDNTLTTKNERFCMLSSSEICEWLRKVRLVRLRRKSAEVYSKCSKWWPLPLTCVHSQVSPLINRLCRSRSVEQMT